MRVTYSLLVLLALGVGGLSSASAQCDYTLNLYDSFGDGWDGAYLEVFVDGVSSGTFTIRNGSFGSFTFTAPPGTTVEFSLPDAGIYPNEISYDIVVDSATVYSGDGNAVGTTVYSNFCYDNLPNNAGVVAMISPTSPINNIGLSQVAVTVRNFGPDTLTTFEVAWELDGVQQSRATYSGLPIMPRQVSNVVLGNVSLAGSNEFDFRFWTENPNGLADRDPSNDTLAATVCVPLQGTYSVGTVTSDFPSLQEAIDATVNCGVNGPTTFNVAPGLYLGSYTIPEISGAGASAPVVFDGGDSTTTTISYDGTGAAYPTLQLEGADYITIRNFRIRNVSTTDSWGIHLSNEANNNIIENNSIIVYNDAASTSLGIGASGSNVNPYMEGSNNFNTIQGNTIFGGQSGVYFVGQAGNGNRSVYNRFLDNTIHNSINFGINVSNQDSIEISGNRVYDVLGPFGRGIYVENAMQFVLTGNNVSTVGSGISIFRANSSTLPTRRGLIANNMCRSISNAALFLNYVEETDIWHNTLMGTNGIFIGNRAGLDIQNNIFVGTQDYAFATSNSTPMDAMDYNLYYVMPGNFDLVYYDTTAYTDLAAWQASAFAYDANSVEGNPSFVSRIDLHVLGMLANDAGNATVNITTDIDGDLRPTGAGVDIGADEFQLATYDAQALAIISPSAANCGNTNQAVEVVISSLGSAPIGNMTIVVEDVNTGTSISTTYAGSLAFGQKDTVTVGTVNTYNGGQFDLIAYTQLSGDQNSNNDTAMLSVLLAPSSPLTAVHDTACVGTVAELTVTPALPLVSWYDAPVGGNLLAQSLTYTTTPLTDNDTLYAEQAPLPGPCEYTLNLFDSGTDGWNGASIEVFVDGLSVGTYGDAFNLGGFASYTIPVPLGATLEIIWNVAGSYPAEISYDIELDGVVIFNNGLTPNSGGAVGGGSGRASPSNLFTYTCTGGYNNPSPVFCNANRTRVIAYSSTPPVVDLGPDLTTCRGAAVTLDAQIPNSHYAWSTNEFTQSIAVEHAGSYNVRVITPYACIVFDTIVIDTFPRPNITANITDIDCAGNLNGEINQTITGTVGSYSVTWNDGQTTEDISSLAAGIYIATLVDSATGCGYTESYTVRQPYPMNASTTVTNAACDGVSDGAIDISLTGGTAPYHYMWSNSSTAEDLSAVASGNYTLTVTDNRGCTLVTSAAVNENAGITIDLDSLQDETKSVRGAIYISVYNGASPYFVKWNNGQTTEDLRDAVAANYSVVVTDANGCTATADYTVSYILPNAVQEIEGLQSWKVYPNPSTTKVWIDVELKNPTEMQVELFDVAGRQLQVLEPQISDKHTFELNMTEYASGVYNARLIIGNQVATQRIILQK